MRPLQKMSNDTESGAVHLNECRVPFRMRTNSRIKRSRLLVSPEEGLVVETPKAVTLRRAHKLIHRKKEWVLDALASVKEKQLLARDVKSQRNSVLIFGKEKIIVIKRNQTKDFVLETENRITLGFAAGRLPEGHVDTTLNAWLRAKAERYLPLRVNQIGKQRFKINNIVIKDQKTLWGSCSSENNLNLNWRLIMAPRYASDYIIMHELCHTRHLDHSDKFWETVSSVCPNYDKAEKWFTDFGFVLHIDYVDPENM